MKLSNLILNKLKADARQYATESLVNPTEADFLYAENCFLKGALIKANPPRCKHEVKEIPGDYYAKDKWRSDGASCMHCDYHMGWYCPNSPNHICNYEQEDGTHDDDHCVWCHMPNERK